MAPLLFFHVYCFSYYFSHEATHPSRLEREGEEKKPDDTPPTDTETSSGEEDDKEDDPPASAVPMQ